VGNDKRAGSALVGRRDDAGAGSSCPVPGGDAQPAQRKISRPAPWIAEARCGLCLQKTVVRRRSPTISLEDEQ
jgi:hypothetical protein